MTQHELLDFVKGLRDYLERETSLKGEMCWPTRPVLLENLKYNQNLWGRSWKTGFQSVEHLLKRKGWLFEEPCGSDCHAQHVKISSEGLQALQIWEDRGCPVHKYGARDRECHRQFLFHRKRAA
jgi:hypothetical protein